MRKESNHYGLWQRFGAMVLAFALVFGMIPVTGVAAAGNIGTVQKTEDPETLTRPQAIYGDNTLNAGKVTVGKSVSKDAITVDGKNIGLTDDNNFLITISQTAQVMGLSSETSVPVDVVFVLDMSNSMEDEVDDLVAAANNAIATLMAANENNRVAVVGFSGGSGAGTSGGAHANVLSSLAHYTGDAATNHLQWVNENGELANKGGFIAGRDQATITVTTGKGPNKKEETKTVYAYRDGTSSGTNIHAGIALGGSILEDADPEHLQVNGVTRIPFLVVMSDGDPTLAAGSGNVETWYDPSLTDQLGNIVSYDGLGFLAAMTAAYYKGRITEKYFGASASESNRCFIYTMGLGLSDGGMGEMTMDPSGVTNNSNLDEFEAYWDKYEEGKDFNVKVGSGSNYKITANSIADTEKYVYGTGLGYTGSYKYNDAYFSASQGSELEQAFTDIVSEISKKAITVPTKVTTGDHDFDGYITFTDRLGEYMEVKDMKGIIADGYFYQGVSAAQYMTSGSNSEFNEVLDKVLATRMNMTGSDVSGATLLEGAKASPYQAYYNSPTDYDNSIVWWGKGYHIDGEEDPGMQVLGSAYNDSIEYITADSTEIPEGATHVCRSYFFYGEAGGANTNPNHEYLYFVVRVQRSLTAPYQQTVVISAPASLLSVEKVMINESFDDNGDPVYTASVTEAAPARVVYEVGLWDTINEQTVSTIVSETYRSEAVNGEGQVNYDPETDTYWFFTNDWDRAEDQDSHHRAMAKATFDAAADNSFYTYQEDTLLVDANGDPVTSDPRGTKVYYVRTYYDWTGAALENGAYEAVKKTQLIEVDVPADAELIQKDGGWYIPKGAYTAATLIVNGDDTVKSDNATNTSEVVAHPHRTGDAGNSHYTVLLGNNGSISLKSNVPAPTKTVSNVTRNIVDADGKSVMVGEELEYTIKAKNYGAEAGTITVTDTVPAGTVFVSADNGVTPDGEGKLTWVLENVAPGAEVTVSFRVKVTEDALDNAVVSSAIRNTATAQLNNSPAYDTNTTTNPPQGKKVVVQGSGDGSSVQVGDVLQYSIEFHNDTGAVAHEITVVDTLPAGTTFISADHNGAYDADAHTVTWTFTDVAAGAGGVVTFTVQVNASAVTPIENGATITVGEHSYTTNTTSTSLEQGSLVLKKTVSVPQGLDPTADTFVLTLTDPTGNLNGTYSGVTFVNGVATVEIRHGETVTIEGLAAGTTILVTESVPAGFKAAFTGNGQAVIPADGAATVEVTNTYSASSLEVTLQGDKTLAGGSPDEERFGFTVVPCDADGNPTGAAVSTGEVTLSSGTETFSFGKLTFNAPGTYRYLITEVNGGQTGVTYTEAQYLVTIVVVDNGEGKLVQEGEILLQYREGDSGAFADYTGAMLFTNEYQPLSTAVTFTGTKSLTGRDLKAGEFSFVVTEDGAVVSTGSNNADGTVSFRPITYTEAGTHTYVITEQAGNLPGVTYSAVSYTVTVEVVDVDGQLVATVTGADAIAFENTFDPEEVTVTLEAAKELTGAALTEGQFSFVVKDDSGNQVASGSNDATGKITFSKIEYFLADLEGATSKTFHYTITELVPDSGVDPSMYYDGLVIDVSVTVTYDPATGVLSVGEPVYSADTTFNNVDNPDTITVIPNGSKVTTGAVPDGVRFSFSVHTIDWEAEDALGTIVSSGISDANGAIAFNGITYDFADLEGAPFVVLWYWIVEDRAGTTNAGITYDGSRYLLEVTLSVENNALQTEMNYYALREDTDPADPVDPADPYDYTMPVDAAQVVFRNAYEIREGAPATMQVSKDLVNLDLTAGKFEFGLYHIDGGQEKLVLTAVNDASGLVTFTRNYGADILAQGQTAREIHYVIRELNNNIHGVDYTDALNNPIYVKVVITDQGDGTMKTEVFYYSDAAMQNEVDEPKFTNTYTPEHIHVNLEATKELTGRDLESGEFAFVVLDDQGNEVAWATNDADGSIVFSNLVYGFADAGKTFVYTVKEVKPDLGADPNLYYDPSEFTVEVTVSYSETTGLLTCDIAYPADMEFNNIQNPATVTVTPAGTKTINDLTGAADVSGLRFSFRVIGLEGSDLSAMTKGAVEATGISTGSNAIHFTGLVFDDADVGKTFWYYIEEIAADEVNTVTYSAAKYGMSVRVYRDASNYNALATEVTYYNIPTAADVTAPASWTAFRSGDKVDFVNDYEGAYATLNIEGTKDMQGNKTLRGGEFDFRLQVLDGSGIPIPGAIVDGVNEADGSITFGTLIFTDNQMTGDFLVSTVDNQDGTVTNVYEYRAVISEIVPANNAIPGVTYSDQLYLAVIRWEVTTDTATSEVTYGQPAVAELYEAQYSGSAVVAKNAANLLDSKSLEDALTFTNVYAVTTGTSVTMEVTKELVNLALTAGKFEFGLYHNGQLVATATNAADGTVTFTREYPAGILVAYDTDGDGVAVIEYVIRELNNNIHGVEYAANEVRVTVQIEDDGQGGMKAPVVTYLDPAVFTNTYTPEHIHVNLEATKKLTGRDLESGEFAFVVLDDQGNEVAWATNDADGSIVFSNLVYGFADAGKTFVYTVKEVKPDLGADPNLYYDPSEFTVEVTVSYSETTGLLTCDIAYPADMEFNNIQNPATVTVTPEGSKSTTGNAPDGTKFSYTVIDAQTGTSVAAGTSGIDGAISFSTLIYDAGDVGNTYYYWIVEDNGGSTHAGIAYDGAKYLMVVTVSRNATGAMVAEVSYYTVAEGGDYTNEADRTAASVAFTNVYRVTEPANVTITAEKALTGRDLRAGEFSFNLYHLHEGSKTLIATTSNGHSGNAATVFFARTYAPSILTEHGDGTTATIYYVIEEQNNGLGGVDYSQALPIYVKVVITDLENGTMDVRVTYYTDEACTQEITGTPAFVNDYSTDNEGYTPAVDKVLDGRDMADDEFSFVVTDLLGNPVSYGLSKKAASGEKGVIVFNEITYTYEQFITATERNAEGDAIFRYIISEIPGNLVNVSYTDARIYLQVTVKDLGNGNLEATGKYFSDEACTQEITGTPVFTNTYTALGTTVTLEAGKTLTGREAVDGEFSFQVKDSAGNVVATGGNNGGAVVFSGIGITADMMEGQLTKDFVFTLEELNTNQGAMTFDINKYYAKVTVTNNLATGKLEVTAVTYYSDAACRNALSAAPEFVNDYAPTPAELVIPIHKDLINHTLEQGMFEFVLMLDGQHVGDVTNDGNGNASFNIHYHVEMLDGVAPDANNVRSKTFVYTITEVSGTADSADDNGTYTYDDAVYTVTVILTDDGKGNLSTSVTVEKNGAEAENVIFTNSFTPDPVTVDLDTAFGATKTIVDDEGNVIRREDVEFTFVVTDLNGNEITTGTASGADAVDGVMNIDFGSFTFTVEGEYRYLITERATTLAGYELDTTVWCAHILVRYDPDTGKLSVSDSDVYTHILAPEGHAEEGIQAQAEETPVFVNVYHADDVQLHLVMDKTMTGDRTAAKEHEFKFQLLAEDGTIVGEAWNRADGTIHFYLDYTLQDLLDQPSRTFTYTVREIIPEGGNVHNGITYDTGVYTLTVTLTDNGAGELVTTLGGDVVAGTVYTGIEFVNEYIAQDVTVSFHAIKRMEGMPLSDGLYTFYLMDGEEILATGTNLADGTIVFDKTLTFTEPGTYTYTMVEYKDTMPGVTFDETGFQVTVVVTDNGLGNLEYEITYATEEGVYDQPVFINIYKPTGINVVINAHKDLEGRELGEEFNFQLKDSQGNVVGEATNAADGSVTFGSLHYEEVGTYTYTIEEVIPDGAVENEDGTFTLNGVTYDNTVYTVVVEITDPGYDGQLDKSVTYYLGAETVEEAEVIFTNTYAAADSNGVVIEGTKVLENQDLREDAFEFQLKDSQGNVLQTKSHDADGLFSFDALVYTFADLEGQTEKVFTYTVSEVLGDLGGVTYDKTVYTVTVTVTDDGLGNLTAVAVVTGGKNDGAIVFTNVYATDVTTADVEAVKELTGKDLEDGEFEFVLVNRANADEKYTVSNKADGTVLFEDLSFSVAGTYVYDLYEQAGSDKHYTYDDKVFTVTVTVVDNGDGTMTASVSYSETPVFKNVYRPDPITVTLEGRKNLTGKDLEDGEFEFEVRDADGRLVTTGANKADGAIDFEAIVIDTEMELTLYVTEVKGTDKHMVYDDYTYRVKLSVVNNNGTLEATVTYLDGDVIFYNEYKIPETPETGDDTPVHIYMGLMAASAVALMAVLVLGSKKRERKFC